LTPAAARVHSASTDTGVMEWRYLQTTCKPRPLTLPHSKSAIFVFIAHLLICSHGPENVLSADVQWTAASQCSSAAQGLIGFCDILSAHL